MEARGRNASLRGANWQDTKEAPAVFVDWQLNEQRRCQSAWQNLVMRHGRVFRSDRNKKGSADFSLSENSWSRGAPWRSGTGVSCRPWTLTNWLTKWSPWPRGPTGPTGRGRRLKQSELGQWSDAVLLRGAMWWRRKEPNGGDAADAGLLCGRSSRDGGEQGQQPVRTRQEAKEQEAEDKGRRAQGGADHSVVTGLPSSSSRVAEPKRKLTACLRCLEEGHCIRECRNQVRCRYCRVKGHSKTSCPRLVSQSRPGASAGARGGSLGSLLESESAHRLASSVTSGSGREPWAMVPKMGADLLTEGGATALTEKKDKDGGASTSTQKKTNQDGAASTGTKRRCLVEGAAWHQPRRSGRHLRPSPMRAWARERARSLVMHKEGTSVTSEERDQLIDLFERVPSSKAVAFRRWRGSIWCGCWAVTCWLWMSRTTGSQYGSPTGWSRWRRACQ